MLELYKTDAIVDIYLDETLPLQLKEKAEAVQAKEGITAEEKIVELVSSLIHAVGRYFQERWLDEDTYVRAVSRANNWN